MIICAAAEIPTLRGEMSIRMSTTLLIYFLCTKGRQTDTIFKKIFRDRHSSLHLNFVGTFYTWPNTQIILAIFEYKQRLYEVGNICNFIFVDLVKK